MCMRKQASERMCPIMLVDGMNIEHVQMKRLHSHNNYRQLFIFDVRICLFINTEYQHIPTLVQIHVHFIELINVGIVSIMCLNCAIPFSTKALSHAHT